MEKLKIEDIRLICLDCDGVLTNSMYHVSNDGSLTKSFNTRDFWAIGKLLDKGYQVRIISKCCDDVLKQKVGMVNWKTHQNFGFVTHLHSKKEWLDEWLSAHGLTWDNVAFIGDAEGDLECMQSAAMSVCPRDAVPIIQEGDVVLLNSKGGEGVVYEFVQWLVYKRT